MDAIQIGDTVGIIAPAGYIKRSESIDLAIKLLEGWGLKVVLAPHLFSKYHHFAGSDKERISDFQQFLDDPTIKAIWCARGGYGSIRIIDQLDFTRFKKYPKWIIGYSDITVFHQAIHRLGYESIHAFMSTSMESIQDNAVTENLRKVLFGKTLTYTFDTNPNNVQGEVEGKVIGGNVSVMASLLGTPYSIQPKGHILFLEDIGEYKYRIDRMLYSLKLNGYFEHCKGLIVGSFTNIPVNDPLFGKTIEEMILEVTAGSDFPICFDFKAGHIAQNNPLVFGRKARLSVSKASCSIMF